jgi:septal ring factor EnvC (AmiA/AmiB activator)
MICRLLLLLGVASAGFAADPALDALLVEVREIRLAVQRAASVGPRLEITMRRLELQEQRVARAADRLADVRKRLSGIGGRQTELTSHLKSVESDLAQAPAERRQAAEHLLSGVKREIEQTARMESQLRGDEAEASSELRVEQAKADELANKIAGLEIALTPPAQPPR